MHRFNICVGNAMTIHRVLYIIESVDSISRGGALFTPSEDRK